MQQQRRRRNLDDVVTAAFELLEQDGLEALTLRAIARRLDAHLYTVSFQVKTKAGLLDLMADRILAGISLADLPADPTERALTIAGLLRQALLSHRDGGRLIAGTSVFGRHTMAVGDALVGALLAGGATELAAARGCWTIVYLTLGLVIEEQNAIADADGRLAEVIGEGGYPALAQVAGPLVDDSYDDRFSFGVRALLSASGQHPL